jgi:hypothetical protein
VEEWRRGKWTEDEKKVLNFDGELRERFWALKAPF